MKLKSLLIITLSLAFSAPVSQSQGDLVGFGDAIKAHHDLNNAASNPPRFQSIFGMRLANIVPGDTYNTASIVQGDGGAAYLSSPGNVLHTFNQGSGKAHGANGSYAPGTVDMVVSEALTDLGGNQFLVQVEITAVDSGGGRVAWVAPGTTLGGLPLTSWRMDLGTAGAASDRLLPAGVFTVDNATMTVFNSAGTALATFAMSSDVSDPSGLAGLGVIGLGGADIAGFDMASFQLAWTYTVAVPEPGTGALWLLVGTVVLTNRRRRMIG